MKEKWTLEIYDLDKEKVTKKVQIDSTNLWSAYKDQKHSIYSVSFYTSLRKIELHVVSK